MEQEDLDSILDCRLEEGSEYSVVDRMTVALDGDQTTFYKVDMDEEQVKYRIQGGHEGQGYVEVSQEEATVLEDSNEQWVEATAQNLVDGLETQGDDEYEKTVSKKQDLEELGYPEGGVGNDR